jgi:hypothetical protein
VRGLQRVDDLAGDRQRLGQGNRAARDALLERFAVDELQHEEPAAVDLLEAVDRADLRVVERGQHARLALEAGHPVGVGREVLGKQLDRDRAAELGVLGEVDRAHPAFADLVGNAVVQQGLAGLDRHGEEYNGDDPVARWRRLPLQCVH